MPAELRGVADLSVFPGGDAVTIERNRTVCQHGRGIAIRVNGPPVAGGSVKTMIPLSALPSAAPPAGVPQLPPAIVSSPCR